MTPTTGILVPRRRGRSILVALAACGPTTPASDPTTEPQASVEPSASPTTEAAAEVPSAEPEFAAPARKTFDLTQYDVPFSIELGESATQKKLSDAQAKAGFVGRAYERLHDPHLDRSVEATQAPARSLLARRTKKPAHFFGFDDDVGPRRTFQP